MIVSVLNYWRHLSRVYHIAVNHKAIIRETRTAAILRTKTGFFVRKVSAIRVSCISRRAYSADYFKNTGHSAQIKNDSAEFSPTFYNNIALAESGAPVTV
jgi:hypothetical protein